MRIVRIAEGKHDLKIERVYDSNWDFTYHGGHIRLMGEKQFVTRHMIRGA